MPGSVQLLPALCPQPGQPLELGRQQPDLPLLRMDRGHGLPAHSGASGPTPGTTCPRRGQRAALQGAAIAEPLGRAREETGRETNLFQALSASLGPIFSFVFFFYKESYTKPYMTKTQAGLHFFSVSLEITVSFRPLPCRGLSTSMLSSSRQHGVPSPDPVQQRLGTNSTGKE